MHINSIQDRKYIPNGDFPISRDTFRCGRSLTPVCSFIIHFPQVLADHHGWKRCETQVHKQLHRSVSISWFICSEMWRNIEKSCLKTTSFCQSFIKFFFYRETNLFFILLFKTSFLNNFLFPLIPKNSII